MSFEDEQVEHADSKIGSKASDFEAATGIDEVYERKLLHKIDIRLLPILGALYSIALIDRTNMSNAAVAGMLADLRLDIGSRYSIALLVFFIPYFLFELPSNLVLRRVGAAAWLGSIGLAWGTVMIGMGFVKDWKALTALRVILGFFEAGFFPACVYLVSSWYVRFEVQKRMAGFYLVSVLIGGFSSILAYGLMQMDGILGIRGWSWIFIIEGVITCVLALIGYVIIIDFPDRVLQRRNGKFLSAGDVMILKARIDRDRDDSTADSITWEKVGEHLSDWKLWVFSLLFMCTTVPSYAFAYFLPIILEGMGYSAALAQILSAPPCVVSCIVGYSLAVVADRIHMRSPIIALQACMCIVGLSITAYATENNGARFFGVFVGLSGAQGNVPAVLSYQSNNIRMNSKRSVGSALQVGFGAIGGIMASTVFRSQDSPRYLNGIWVTIGCQFLILTLLVIMTAYFRVKNRQHREGTLKEPLEGHPKFTYTY